MRNLTITAAIAGLALTATPAAATILTFDIDNTQPNNVIAMDQGYGDRVLATVQGNATYGVGAEGFTGNILASYVGGTATAALTRWTTDYGDLVNILENEDDGDTLLGVNLTADAGFLAQLYGFDLGGWPNTDYTIAGVSVFDGATQLFSQSNVLVQGTVDGGPRRTSFAFATPLSGANLQIRIDLTGLGGDSDNIGIDNIRFGQNRAITGGVPEPATWAMMIAGFGLVGGVMRRRGAAPALA